MLDSGLILACDVRYERCPICSISQVKAEISQMHINGMESGGSFEFVGSVCTTNAKARNISHLRKVLIEVRIYGLVPVTCALYTESSESYIDDSGATNLSRLFLK